jgi:hypothetical protein
MAEDARNVKHDWIIGVFDDLIKYVEMNDLKFLAPLMREMKQESEFEIFRQSRNISKNVHLKNRVRRIH